MPRSAPCRLTASIAAGFLLDALLLTGCAATAPTPGGISVIEGQETATPAIPMGDRATIRRVLDIARHDSRVMDDLTYICTTFGPRLTGSTAAEDAGRWALDQFESWGLSNAHMQPWGELGVRFDRLESTGEIVSKKRGRGSDDEDEWETDRELEFTTLAWTRGTDGPVVGRVVRMPESIDAVDPEALSGAWVLVPAAYGGRRGVRSIGFEMRERLDLRHSIRTGAYDPFADPEPEEWNGTINYGGEELPLKFLPQRDDAGVITGGRLTISGPYDGPIENVAQEDKTLTFDWPTPHMTSKIELAIDDKKLTGKADGEYAISLEETVPQDQHAMTRASDQILARVLEAEPAGFLSASLDERVWTTRPNNWRDITVADVPRDIEINVRRSDYDAINSRLADGQEVDARFNLHHVLTEGPIAVYNTIAEIRGVTKPDEVVIVSAHLDSWNGPGSQGTTDNGTGSSVVLEAARLLAESGARPDRTIRFILWTGEEQGLCGSQAYAESLSPEERSKISVAFVDDGGTNYEGGLGAADCMIDQLAAATAPVNNVFYSETDGKYLNVNIHSTGPTLKQHGGSDHASFNKVGVPGFFWDEIGRADYGRGWHTQFDRLDLAIPEYLVQSSACMAITAYDLACAPGLLARDAEEQAQLESVSEQQAISR